MMGDNLGLTRFAAPAASSRSRRATPEPAPENRRRDDRLPATVGTHRLVLTAPTDPNG
jgi:hypothetical protein